MPLSPTSNMQNTGTTPDSETSHLLQSILNQLPTGVIAYTAIRDPSGAVVDFEVVSFNKQAVELTGLQDRLTHGICLLTLYPIQEEYIKKLQNVINKRETFSFDHYYAPTRCWLRIHCSPLGDGCLTTFEDITEEKLKVRQLQQQVELFNRVLDNMLGGVLILKAHYDEQERLCDMEYLGASLSNEQFSGIPRDEFIGNRMLSLYPDAVQTELWERYEQVLKTGEPQRFEEYYGFNGLDIWLDVSLARLTPDTLLSCFQAITETKRSQQQLEDKNRKLEDNYTLLRSVIDHSPCGLALFEAVRDNNGQIEDFRCLLTNRINAALINKSVEELEGQRCLAFFPALWQSSLEKTLHEVIETGELRRMTIPLEVAEQQNWFDILFVRHGDGVLTLFLDITEAHRANERTELLNKELRRSNENLQQFAYIASHDLQEPLRKIQSFSDILQQQYAGQFTDNGADLISRMQSAARRMQLLVQDLLTYSRLSTHPAVFAPVDLKRLLSVVQNDLEISIQNAKAIVTVEEMPVIPGDPNQLRQLFQNLLSNAIKFQNPGVAPTVHIRSERLPGSHLPDNIPLPHNRKYICIEVTDNGIGFDEKYLDRIFVMFQRLHGKQKFEGTGIGLAICRKVTENHDGFLTARSQPGLGATFLVILPLSH